MASAGVCPDVLATTNQLLGSHPTVGGSVQTSGLVGVNVVGVAGSSKYSASRSQDAWQFEEWRIWLSVE